MIALLRKNLSPLILNPNSNNVCGSPIYFSLYLNNFCTSSESEPCINRKLSEIMVHKHNFDPEFASRVAPKLSHLRKGEDACSTLSFLRESGLSDCQLEKIVSYKPQLLSGSTKPKFKFFRELGLSFDSISKIILDSPGVFCLSLNNNIIPSVALLKRLSGSNDAVVGVIQKAPRILASNLENTVLPKVEFFKSCGVPFVRIRRILNRRPTLFLSKLEVLKKYVEKVEEMGIDTGSKSFIYAVSTISSMSDEVWALKLQALRALGFSDSDIMIMFRKAPLAFCTSIEKMKEIIELLLDTKKYTYSCIVDCPSSLLYSIEKRYMPRLQILGTLECRNLVKEWPSLSRLVGLSDDEFSREFSVPYSDKVRDVCSVDSSAGNGSR